jgi:hypothetical protein
MNWNDPHLRPDEDYELLCKNSVPSDFYFSVMREDDNDPFTLVSIVPKLYWEENAYMWDQTMFLDHILPPDLSESMECIYDSDRSVEEVRKDMLARGFLENDAFSKIAFEDQE